MLDREFLRRDYPRMEKILINEEIRRSNLLAQQLTSTLDLQLLHRDIVQLKLVSHQNPLV